MAFQPGQSGNPGGRPREIGDLRELARARSVDAIGTLATIMMSKKAPAAARVSAACVLLDRGYGKVAPADESLPMLPRYSPADLLAGDRLELARRIALILAMAGRKLDVPTAIDAPADGQVAPVGYPPSPAASNAPAATPRRPEPPIKMAMLAAQGKMDD